MIIVRKALPDELPWINKCYDEVDFVHSDFDNEIIAIAECDGEKVGLGRVIKIDENNLELGGMYVFEKFRGQGAAGKIVQFLIKIARPTQTIYCIPFEHLTSFYKSHGFEICSSEQKVPDAITKKTKWCTQHYETPTALLCQKL